MSAPNFQIEATDGRRYWVSRSIAVVVVLLYQKTNSETVKTGVDRDFYTPLGYRSNTMALEPNKWGILAGFLDWDETIAQAIIREAEEELGLLLHSDYVEARSRRPNLVVSFPDNSDNQTVSLRYILNIHVGKLPELTPDRKEVTSAKWLHIPYDRASRSWLLPEIELAFNHHDILQWAIDHQKTEV